MNNVSMYQINYTPFPRYISPNETMASIPPVQAKEINYSPNFEQDYYATQNALSVNNQVFINRNNNYNVGRNIMNEFYAKYPRLDSFTMSETVAKNLERNHANEVVIKIAKEKADKDFYTMRGILDNRPENKNITFSQYITQIEREFKEYNHANCAERAYYLHDIMNKKGIENAIIEIGGKEA